MPMTAEVREELLSLVRQEIEQQEQKKAADKVVYRRICEGFKEELDSFTYTKTHEMINRDGSSSQYEISCLSGWKIRDAISVLLRVIFQVNLTAKLPSEKEEEIREFVGSILQLMKTLKAESLRKE